MAPAGGGVSAPGTKGKGKTKITKTKSKSMHVLMAPPAGQRGKRSSQAQSISTTGTCESPATEASAAASVSVMGSSAPNVDASCTGSGAGPACAPATTAVNVADDDLEDGEDEEEVHVYGKRKKKCTSWVWKYFTKKKEVVKVEGNEVVEIWGYCNFSLCGKRYRAEGVCGTTAFKNHLKSIHSIVKGQQQLNAGLDGMSDHDGRDREETPTPTLGLSSTSIRELRRMVKEKHAVKKGKRNAGLEEAGVTPVAKKLKTGLVPEDLKMDGSSATTKKSVVVAFTPGMPDRFASLLRNITSMLSCENHGKAYECPLDRINIFLEWSECSFCLFFKWVEKDQKMFCQMFNMLSRMCVTFLVNPAFPYETFEVQVKSAAFAFSSSFCCDDKWAVVKEFLKVIFHPQQEIIEAPDHLYVFTRIDDYVYIRNMKMNTIPDVSSSEEAFVLQEMGPSFSLKLLDIQDVDGSHIISDRVCDVSQNQSQMKPDRILSPTVYYSTSPDELGSCIAHTFSLSDVTYMVLLESGMNLSEFEGFNVSLRDYLVKESFLKIKKIIGSLTDEESLFVRNIAKFIIRSILAELIELFASGKCMDLTNTKQFGHSNILLKGSLVKFCGVKIVKYEEEKARNNVLKIVKLIEECFPTGLIPSDLKDVLEFLLENPLENLEVAKGSSALLSAGERRELLVYLHTQFMTNVKPCLRNTNRFFEGCPYLFTWMDTVKKNIYLEKSANLETKRVSLIVKEVEKVSVDKSIGAKGEFQFSFMRNSNVHIPEKASKDGFKSFRLTWSDYILTAYFRKYLAFIQKRMAPYLKSKGDHRRQS